MTAHTAPATDARSVLANNHRLLFFYAGRAVPRDQMEDVAQDAAVAFLRCYDPARGRLSGFVRVVIRTYAHKHRVREAVHQSRRHHPADQNGDLSGDGTEAVADYRSEPGLGYDEAAALDRALRRLGKQARTVLALRFGLSGSGPATLQEIANRLGVSKARVGQVEAKALRKLREILAPATEVRS